MFYIYIFTNMENEGTVNTGVAKYARVIKTFFVCITFVFVRAKISEKSMMNGIVRTHFIG